MKYVLAILLCFFTSFGFAAEDEVVTLFIKQLQSQIERIDDPTYYSGKIYINKTTKEKTNFALLSETEKKVFYMWQAEVMSKKLLAFEYSLEGETAEKIFDLRKQMAIRQENLAEKTFTEIGDDIIPKVDKMNHLKQIQKWNEEQGLIKRIQ